MRIGIFGGSFDPIHLGHLLLAQKALEQYALERIHFVVAHHPPHRHTKKLSEGSVRLALVTQALKGNPVFLPDDRELLRAGASYTLDTLTSFDKGDELFFLLGSDSLFAFSSWYEPQEILKRTTILVGNRPPHTREQLVEQAEELMRQFGGKVEVLDFPWVNISSTTIREEIRLGASARYQVPESVRREIERLGLYR